MSFPTAIDEITSDWVSQIFGVPVDIEIEPLGSEGPGFVSDMCRLNLSSDDPNVPARAVVKVNPSFEGANDLATRYRVFEREALFYKEGAVQTPIRTPRIYFADADPTTTRGIIVMEDCSDYEVRPMVEKVPATVEEVRWVANTSARLHGHWWGGDSRKTQWAMAPGSALWKTFFGDCAAMWPVFNASEAADALSPRGRQLAQRLERAFASKVMNAFPQDRLTLCHLDYHIDNMFFEPSADDPVIVIDWQGVHWGRGVFDMAYFLGTAYESEMRASVEQNVLEHYLEVLRARDVDYESDDLWNDYRFGALFGLWVVPLAIANLDFSSDFGQRLLNKVVLCKFEAALDHGAMEILDTL
jgi:hypothetical protein